VLKKLIFKKSPSCGITTVNVMRNIMEDDALYKEFCEKYGDNVYPFGESVEFSKDRFSPLID